MNNPIVTIAREAYLSAPVPSVRQIKKDLRKGTADLFRIFSKCEEEDCAKTQQIIRDHYYIIEREAKGCARSLDEFKEQTIAPICAVAKALFFEQRLPVDEENISAMIAGIQTKKPLSIAGFDCIAIAVKIALLYCAFAAYRLPQKPAMEMLDSFINGIYDLGSVDFLQLTEQHSEVHAILMQDPTKIYEQMTQDSRRHYRYLVAKIAKKNKMSEILVASNALEAAKQSEDERKSHVGYFIVHHPALEKSKQKKGKLLMFLYFFVPLVFSVLFGIGAGSLLVGILSYLPLFEAFRPFCDMMILTATDVDFIPRMDLSRYQAPVNTLITVSTLVPKTEKVQEMADRLKRLYHANKGEHMYFCILADYKESDYPTNPEDKVQAKAACKVVAELNEQYGDRFFLFIRNRSYSKTQQKYSGWERKRGAITQLVRFIKGESVDFAVSEGKVSLLADMQYLVALDSDTVMGFESADTMLSAAVHPLNKPYIDMGKGMVTEGYGVFAPELKSELLSAKETPFSRIMAGIGGITPYDLPCKNVYQDVFGRGIFSGKGLIDINAFYLLLNDRFPENTVLSHDILEGEILRTAYVYDAQMLDGVPNSMRSWLSRFERWTRGDWQNIKYLRPKSGFSLLSRYKLFDNLRRSITPFATLVAVIVSFFVSSVPAVYLCTSALLSLMLLPLYHALVQMITGGLFVLSRQYFSNTVPEIFENIGRALFYVIMLAVWGLTGISAAIKSLYRLFISHKNLLQWVTAAQSQAKGNAFSALAKEYWLPQIIGIALLFAPNPFTKLFGICLSFILLFGYFTAKPSPVNKYQLKEEDREFLLSYCASMFEFYEELAGEDNHYLPPDNVQQSPVYRIAYRTSPTNIGMMLLSVLAARDMGILTTDEMITKIKNTLTTVEQLEKYKGNLYNWYDTKTLQILPERFVSTVDSGNFLCCLTALKEGIREYMPHSGLILRIEKLIQETDITFLYDERRHLFSIGYDETKDCFANSYYDFLMSEARMTSYFAVASKRVDKKHFSALNRTMARCGYYAGPVSWSGTMFEYFMPHILLPVFDGSLLNEALRFCIYTQRKRVAGENIPWGISESTFFEFDEQLNYQYKAHGVQTIGVKRGLDKELVVSPYSSFLTLPFAPSLSMKNLKKLKSMGLWGRYGFYEAVDFTKNRLLGKDFEITRSFMAHHIGMSMTSAANALFDNIMQRRFMRDGDMDCAVEFLQEKVDRDPIIYENLKLQTTKPMSKKEEESETVTVIHPHAPKTGLLSNSELTEVYTDTGASFLRFGGIELTRRSADLLRRPEGIFTIIKCGGETVPVTAAPFYNDNYPRSVEFHTRNVTYYVQTPNMDCGVQCVIPNSRSCQQRRIAIKNKTNQRQNADVLVYFEPVLDNYRDYSAHPAFSKLFVCSKYDAITKTLLFWRRNRNGSKDMFLAVGFLEDIAFAYETKKENIRRSADDYETLLQFDQIPFSEDCSVPDAVCALKFKAALTPGAEHCYTLLLSAAKTEREAIDNIVASRKTGKVADNEAAVSMFQNNTLFGRIGSNLLSDLFFETPTSKQGTQAIMKNNSGQKALWQAGISGDLPIVLLNVTSLEHDPRLKAYLDVHKTLFRLEIPFDLVIVHAGENLAKERLNVKQSHVYFLDSHNYGEEFFNLLTAAACHIAAETEMPVCRSVENFQKIKIRPSCPVEIDESELTVSGGSFLNGRFYVEKTSPLPYSHILANETFGTMLSDRALGCTWATNSRENRLTPFYNDIGSDNNGEMLILKTEKRYIDLIKGSRATFSNKDAVYFANTNGIATKVTVTIAKSGYAKYCEVELCNCNNQGENVMLAYYTEPVLGVNREQAKFVKPISTNGALIFTNPYNTAITGYSILSADAAKSITLTNRTAFFSGRWNDTEIKPSKDICGAVIVGKYLPPKRKEKVRFILSYGKNLESAFYMAKQYHNEKTKTQNRIIIDSQNKALDQYINIFAPHQIVSSRLFGRCGFYQSGGAYGFRDQLQDACGYLLLNPAYAKRQIYRAAAVQFIEGDVLHWWHNLPKNEGGLTGVRTRYSDDRLWLCWAVCEYIEKTDDFEILKTKIPYLTGDILQPGEQERYFAPQRSDKKESVYEHCKRALDLSLNQKGKYGLLLIGCGDWNDGFNRMGEQGNGMSVWLSMFTVCILNRFSELSNFMQDEISARRYKEEAENLKIAIDQHAWEDDRYLRAFYDDLTPVGSKHSDECKIDSIAQSFAALCDMPDKRRVNTALDSVLRDLVDWEYGIVKLFSPAFQETEKDPGYVKGYPSGLRENGGQYTHAAVWFAKALFYEGRNREGVKIIDLLNPVYRSKEKQFAQNFLTEPYAITGDIYAASGAMGRGGWSQYTGSAAWFYSVVMQDMFGLQLYHGNLRIKPNLPPQFGNVTMRAVLSQTSLHIEIIETGSYSLTVNGAAAEEIALDGIPKSIQVTF